MNRVLYIGRFNPLHLGHLQAIEYIFKTEISLDQLIIGIGTAQESYTLLNPFTSGERFEFLIHALKEKKIPCDKYLIVPVPDLKDNNQWFSYLTSLLPKFDTIYTNNSLVILLAEKFGNIKVNPIPLTNRKEWSATFIRNQMITNDDSWVKNVPSSVIKLISEFEGVKRIQLLSKNDN